MTNLCPNCGADVRYDIDSGQLKCAHCHSLFPVESFQGKTEASETPVPDGKYNVTLYTCPNCGAEISSADTAALDYCLYCGSFVTLEKQFSQVRKPRHIVPFSQTKEKCKTAYRKMISRRLYAPKEFRNEEFLEKFKGIYIPYWSFTYDVGPDFHFNGKTENRSGDYKEIQKYDITCKGSIHIGSMNYDASSTFDDTISAQVSGIDDSRKKKFHPGYMFGFFGDTADVQETVYTEDAETQAEEVLSSAVTSRKEFKTGHPEAPEGHKFIRDMNAKRSTDLTMIPLWFLTWRKGEKVAYSVVNGDSGDIYSEIPVDTTRYLFLSLLTAIPIFFLLNCIVTFNGDDLLFMSMLLSSLFLMIYSAEIERIVRRILHVDDIGYLSKHAAEKKRNETDYSENLLISLFSSVFHGAVDFLKDNVIFGIFIILTIIAGCIDMILIAVAILVVAAPFYTIYRVHENSRILEDSHVLTDIFSPLFSLFFSAAIFFFDPAGDWFYYGAAILSLLTVAYTTVRVLMRYNDLITRPVPNFYDRKEGTKA